MVFCKRQEMLEQDQRAFALWFGNLRHTGCEQRLRANGLYTLKRIKEIDYLIQIIKVVGGLAEIRDHCRSPFQIRRVKRLERRGNDCECI